MVEDTNKDTARDGKGQEDLDGSAEAASPTASPSDLRLGMLYREAQFPGHHYVKPWKDLNDEQRSNWDAAAKRFMAAVLPSREALVAALLKYARHGEIGGDICEAPKHSDNACTCGLESILLSLTPSASVSATREPSKILPLIESPDMAERKKRQGDRA